MSVLIMNWTKGNMKIYTKRLDVAEKAMKKGYFVMVLNERSHIFENSSA